MKTARSLQCRVCDSSTIRDMGQAHGYRFVECPACGFIFTPEVDGATADARYKTDGGPIPGTPQRGWGQNAEFLQPAFDRLGEEQPLRILDFGCGESRLPERLRRRGHRVIGVDLAPPRAPHPDRLTGDLLELALEPGQFDLIYSYQVFEHLPHPTPVLNELLRLTREGGLVVIHTDMDTPQRETGFFNWFYVLPPMHCSYYRLRTFEAALDEQPAEIVWSDPWSVLIQKTQSGVAA